MRGLGPGAALGLLLLAAGAASASAQPEYFVTTVGNDTTSIEQFRRNGDSITGDWVTRQGAVLHHYVLTLGPDHRPARYDVVLSRLGRPRPTLPGRVTVAYGADSATIVTVTDSTITQRVALGQVYPLLGTSVVSTELAFLRLRAARSDTGSFVVHFPTRPAIPPVRLALSFFGPDSARVVSPAGTANARVDRRGHLLGLRAGTSETRRVSRLDLPAVERAFAAADTARTP